MNRTPTPASLLTLCLLLLAPAALAGDAYLVRDLDDREVRPGGLPCFTFGGLCEFDAYGSYPSRPVAFGERVVFTATDAAHGAELWVSDGSPQGTVLVADLCPGSCDGNPFALGAVDGWLVFWGRDDESAAYRLWRSDGTAGGTAPLAGVAPHPSQLAPYTTASFAGGGLLELPDAEYAFPLSLPRPSYHVDPPAVTVAGELLFFADGDDAGGELWASDGTAAGTRRLADMCPGDCDWTPKQVLPATAGVYLVGGEDREGGDFEVWFSDGTAAGTRRLYDSHRPGGADPGVPWPYGSDPQSFGAAVFEGALFVAQGGGEAGLWRLAPTQPPKRVVEGEERSVVQQPVAAAERLVFFLTDNPRQFDSNPPALWWTNGDTVVARNSRLDAHVGQGFQVDETVSVGDRAHFTVLGDDGLPILFSTSGTDLDVDDTPGLVDEARQLALRSVGGHLLVRQNLDAVFVAEGSRWRLWAGDGQPGTLRPVADFPMLTDPDDDRYVIDPEALLFFESPFRDVALAGGRLFFTAADDAETGFELWAVPERSLEPRASARLLGERYEVSVLFEDQHHGGEVGAAVADPLSGDSSQFWFFRPENVELVVKVLDGRGVNGHDWVFHGGNTDLGYRVTVRDRVSGETRVYHRPGGTLCGAADTTAFARAAGAASQAAAAPLSPAPGACAAEPTALCLGENGRFVVRVFYFDHHNGGVDGRGTPQADSDRAGWFWFFRPENLELMVKVLDGQSVNGHYWVLWGGLTDLAYTIEVTDTKTDTTRIFEHAAGDLCGGADTTAF